MIIHEDDGEVEINDAALDDHLRRYREFAIRVLVWNAQPEAASTKAIELLGEQRVLIEDIGIGNLTLHLFNETLSAFPPTKDGDRSGTAAGSLLGAAEFLLRVGKSYLPDVSGLDGVIQDLRNMAKGGAAILSTLGLRAEKPFEDHELTVIENLVLQAKMIAARDSVIWTDTVEGIAPRTLQRLARRVSRDDIHRAERIGHLAAHQIERDQNLRKLEDRITRHSIKDLVEAVINLPSPPEWRRRVKKA